MATRTLDATLVKLAEAGVGVARIRPASAGGPHFVYFRPRDLANYKGETWSELKLRGLTPGRALKIDLDFDSEGGMDRVSSVSIADT